jgi:hypothetical protein
VCENCFSCTRDYNCDLRNIIGFMRSTRRVCTWIPNLCPLSLCVTFSRRREGNSVPSGPLNSVTAVHQCPAVIALPAVPWGGGGQAVMRPALVVTATKNNLERRVATQRRQDCRYFGSQDATALCRYHCPKCIVTVETALCVF